jgi:multicomponent Na+:H+ antiporter subunit D
VVVGGANRLHHALAKGALFLTCACLAMSVSKVRVDTIGGIARRMPWTMAAFVLAGLSLIGVPGTAGFISKWYLITASFAVGPGGILLVAAIVVSSLMAVVYIWRVVEAAYFSVGEANENATEAPLGLLIPTWIAVLLNLYFGLFPGLPLELSSAAAETLLGY